jgi:hypothetical protein
MSGQGIYRQIMAGSDWIGIGCSVCEVMDVLEYVFVGIRTRRSSENEEFK